VLFFWINLTGTQELYINTKLDNLGVSNIDLTWTLKMDGNDTINPVEFKTGLNESNTLSAQGYYQRLDVDFDGIELQDNIHYVLQGTRDDNNEIIYLGKVFVTSTDIANFTVHPDKYTMKNSTNNFTILN